MVNETKQNIRHALGLALERGAAIIVHLKSGNSQQAIDLLTLRKAAIYNFFAAIDLGELGPDERQQVDAVIEKLIAQNELLELKIEQAMENEKDNLKKLVSVKRKFNGYAFSNFTKYNNFEGSA